MSYIVRFYAVNSLTFISNLLLYFMLIIFSGTDRSVSQEHLLSVLSHILTIPVSFFLNYRFVFPQTNENTSVLIRRFVASSLLFIFIFKTLHIHLLQWNVLDFGIHLLATVISSFLNFCVLNFWVFKRNKKSVQHRENQLKLILHPDDFGVCREVTEDIMDCIGKHGIYRTSVICNTEGIIDATKEFDKGKAGFEVGLHLNLVEGKPISGSDRVDLLVDRSTGEFKYSFLTLWKAYLLGNRQKKELLKTQIKSEMESQIQTFNSHFDKENSNGLHIDGHTHIHILPFILDIIIDLSRKYPIYSVRLPNERFFLCKKNLRNYLSANMMKFVVLKILSKVQIPKLKKSGLKYNDYFIGVLATGGMNHESVASALSVLKGVKEDTVVEILFHPGGVRHRESVNWTSNAQFVNYYSDVKRGEEKSLLYNGRLKDVTDKYKLISKL